MNAHLADQIATRDLPPLALRGAFNPRSVNLEARTVEVTWSTGAKVLRGFFDRFYEELSMDARHVRLERLNGGAPVLNTHDNYDLRGVLGVVVEGTAKTDGKRGLATVRFCQAEDDPEADQIFRKVTDGIIQNVSVGYRVNKFQKTDDVENKIPTYRAIDWEPFEISFVPVGADAGAGVRAHATGLATPCEFILPGTVRGLSDADRNRFLRLAHARTKE
jgi:HK97 family phage prohead protease